MTTLRVLATNGCENGPCPTFHKTEGGVIVQAFKTTDPGHVPPGMPQNEGVLFVPDADWQQLLTELFARLLADQPAAGRT